MEVCLSIEGNPRSTCPSSIELRIIFRTQDGTAGKLKVLLWHNDAVDIFFHQWLALTMVR